MLAREISSAARTVLAALSASALLAACASPAPDPGARIAAEADRASKEFDAAWSPKRKSVDDSVEAQRRLQRELFRLRPEAAADADGFCPDGDRSPGELSLFAQINEMFDELNSGVLDQLAVYETWSRRFGEARAAGRPDELKRPLYRELVWSRARLDMLRSLLSTYKIDAEYQALRMQNACLARIILRSDPARKNDAGLAALQERLDRETQRALPTFKSAYHEAFLRIGSTPDRP